MKAGGVACAFVIIVILQFVGGGIFYEDGWVACTFVVGFVLYCCLYFDGGKV